MGLSLGIPEGAEDELPLGADDGPDDREIFGDDDREVFGDDDRAVLKLPLGTSEATEGDSIRSIKHEDDIKIQLDAVVDAGDWDTVSDVSIKMSQIASCHILSNR